LPSCTEIAFQKGTCLLSQDIADDGSVKTGVGDRVLKRAELDRSVILFDHIDDQQLGGRVLCD